MKAKVPNSKTLSPKPQSTNLRSHTKPVKPLTLKLPGTYHDRGLNDCKILFFGGILIIILVEYHPKNPILIIKAPILEVEP